MNQESEIIIEDDRKEDEKQILSVPGPVKEETAKKKENIPDMDFVVAFY